MAKNQNELYHFNPYHDPKNGQFTTSPSGGGGRIASAARFAKDFVDSVKERRRAQIEEIAKANDAAAAKERARRSKVERDNFLMNTPNDQLTREELLEKLERINLESKFSNSVSNRNEKSISAGRKFANWAVQEVLVPGITQGLRNGVSNGVQNGVSAVVGNKIKDKFDAWRDDKGNNSNNKNNQNKGGQNQNQNQNGQNQKPSPTVQINITNNKGDSMQKKVHDAFVAAREQDKKKEKQNKKKNN